MAGCRKQRSRERDVGESAMVRKSNNKGFTLVELLLAMGVFSFVLMFCITIFIQINRLYFRGVNIARAQESSRNIVAELSSGLQSSEFSRVDFSLPVNAAKRLKPVVVNATKSVPQNYFCVGDTVYYYKLGVRRNDLGAVSDPAMGGNHVLARWTDGNFCNALTGGGSPNTDNFSIPSNAAELVDSNTYLHHFTVTPDRIELTISYGDITQLENIDPSWDSPLVRCQGGSTVIYCGVSSLSTDIVRRTR